MNDQELSLSIESLIFCSPNPLTIPEIQDVLQEILQENIDTNRIEAFVQKLIEKYEDQNFAIRIVQIAEGYQFLSKAEFANAVKILLKQKSKKRLSAAALESLSIIAYKQPITKANIEQIRGVNSDYAIQRLLEKDLIEIHGKAQTAGRPLLYGTSKKFMEYFGLNKLQDLPNIKDFVQTENQIGEIQE